MASLKYREIYENLTKDISKFKLDTKAGFNVIKLVSKIDDSYIEEKLDIIIKQTKDKNLAVHILEKMPMLILYNEQEISQKLSLIYNANNLYACILCFDNYYSWCSYNEKSKDLQDEKGIDFNPKIRDIKEDTVIRNIIDSTYRQDIVRFAQIEINDDLETRIKKLKSLNINSNGYRIR